MIGYHGAHCPLRSAPQSEALVKQHRDLHVLIRNNRCLSVHDVVLHTLHIASGGAHVFGLGGVKSRSAVASALPF